MPEPTAMAVMGDLHLKAQVFTAFREARGDTRHALRQIVDWCLANGAGLVLAGDTFDRPILNSEAFLMAQSELRRLDEAELPIWWIIGNHDRATPPWIHALPGVHMHDAQARGEKLHACGFCWYGIDCQDTPEAEAAFRAIPGDVDVVVAHQSLAELFPMDFSYRLEAGFVPDTVKQVVLGHVHDPREYTDPLTEVKFAYTGSGAQLSALEPPQKSFLVVRGSEGRVELERVRIDSRPFHTESQCKLEALSRWGTRSRHLTHTGPEPSVPPRDRCSCCAAVTGHYQENTSRFSTPVFFGTGVMVDGRAQLCTAGCACPR